MTLSLVLHQDLLHAELGDIRSNSMSRSWTSNLQAGKLRHREERCQQPSSFRRFKEKVRSRSVIAHSQIFVQDPDAVGLQGLLDTLAHH